MTRKKFIKLMMATGLSRDEAYYNAVLAQIFQLPYQRALELYAVRLMKAQQISPLLLLTPYMTRRKKPWNL